jgi:hypothetical protein
MVINLVDNMHNIYANVTGIGECYDGIIYSTLYIIIKIEVHNNRVKICAVWKRERER